MLKDYYWPIYYFIVTLFSNQCLQFGSYQVKVSLYQIQFYLMISLSKALLLVCLTISVESNTDLAISQNQIYSKSIFSCNPCPDIDQGIPFNQCVDIQLTEGSQYFKLKNYEYRYTCFGYPKQLQQTFTACTNDSKQAKCEYSICMQRQNRFECLQNERQNIEKLLKESQKNEQWHQIPLLLTPIILLFLGRFGKSVLFILDITTDIIFLVKILQNTQQYQYRGAKDVLWSTFILFALFNFVYGLIFARQYLSGRAISDIFYAIVFMLMSYLGITKNLMMLKQSNQIEDRFSKNYLLCFVIAELFLEQIPQLITQALVNFEMTNWENFQILSVILSEITILVALKDIYDLNK